MNVHEHPAAPARIPPSYLNLAGTLRDQILGLYGAALIHKIPAEHCRSVEFGCAPDEENALASINGRPKGATDEQWRAFRGKSAEAVLACVSEDGFRTTTDIAREIGMSKTTVARVLQVAEMLGMVVSEYRQIGKARGYFWRAV